MELCSTVDSHLFHVFPPGLVRCHRSRPSADWFAPPSQNPSSANPHVRCETQLEWPPPHSVAYCFSSAFPLEWLYSFWWMVLCDPHGSAPRRICFEWRTLRNTVDIVLRVWRSLFFMTRITVPIQPSITCLRAINTWCHCRAFSCFTSVMDGFEMHQTEVQQPWCEAETSGREIAVWSLFDMRCQPKLAAHSRFMDRFTSWG